MFIVILGLEKYELLEVWLSNVIDNMYYVDVIVVAVKEEGILGNNYVLSFSFVLVVEDLFWEVGVNLKIMFLANFLVDGNCVDYELFFWKVKNYFLLVVKKVSIGFVFV